MNNAEIDRLRLNLIRCISEIEDVQLLNQLTAQLNACHSAGSNYPYAPSEIELCGIIDEVLEDDRRGRFMSTEELLTSLEAHRVERKEKRVC